MLQLAWAKRSVRSPVHFLNPYSLLASGVHLYWFPLALQSTRVAEMVDIKDERLFHFMTGEELQ